MLEALALSVITANLCGYDGAAYARGIAVDPRSGKPLYCEYHLPADNGERRVLYYSPDGFRVAEKQLMNVEVPLPQVRQRDFRHGEERRITRDGNGWQLEYRANGSAAPERSELSVNDVDVADAGFDVFVRQRWHELVAGNTLNFSFASPPHGRAIALRAQRDDCKTATGDALCIRVELAQPLLRLFAGNLHLVYDRNTRRLQTFEGVSNLLGMHGDSQRVRIEYTYP